MYFWCGFGGHICISGHVFLQLSSSSKHLASILWDKSSWQIDRRVHLLKRMASGHLKLKKVTCPVLILATWRHTTENVRMEEFPWRLKSLLILPMNPNCSLKCQSAPAIWKLLPAPWVITSPAVVSYLLQNNKPFIFVCKPWQWYRLSMLQT